MQPISDDIKFLNLKVIFDRINSLTVESGGSKEALCPSQGDWPPPYYGISWIRHWLMQFSTQFKLIYFCSLQDLRRLVMEQGKIIEQLMKRVDVSIERQRVSPICRFRGRLMPWLFCRRKNSSFVHHFSSNLIRKKRSFSVNGQLPTLWTP